jgi:aldehyde dehydrogenase (NAD+)
MTAAPDLAHTPSPETLASASDCADRLRKTFQTGRTRPLEWRRKQLEQLKALATENAEELVAALQADFGKPTLEAWTTDVAVVAMDCALALKNLRRWTRPEKVSTPMQQQPGRSRIVRDPLGVVLIIAPWNYPVQLLLSPLVGAIAAGNCAVLKPSEITPHTSAVLAKLIPKYLDPDCITLVEGAVPETTALLAQRFDHIFYTGNGAVARVVLEAAAKHLTPVTLELGGKSPCIIDRNANIEVAARRIAWGKFLNAGQTCVAPDYIAPTLVRNVSPESPLMTEEIFGPILPILTCPSTEEAVQFVNDREKPLALYLFTEDKSVEEKVVSETSSGGVCINAILWHITNPNLPFGGVGPSGTGAYHGRASFETFSHRKSVMTKPTRFDLKLLYPPYGRFKTALVKRML